MFAIGGRNRPSQRHLFLLEHRSDSSCYAHVDQCFCAGAYVARHPHALVVCGPIQAANPRPTGHRYASFRFILEEEQSYRWLLWISTSTCHCQRLPVWREGPVEVKLVKGLDRSLQNLLPRTLFGVESEKPLTSRSNYAEDTCGRWRSGTLVVAESRCLQDRLRRTARQRCPHEASLILHRCCRRGNDKIKNAVAVRSQTSHRLVLRPTNEKLRLGIVQSLFEDVVGPVSIGNKNDG